MLERLQVIHPEINISCSTMRTALMVARFASYDRLYGSNEVIFNNDRMNQHRRFIRHGLSLALLSHLYFVSYPKDQPFSVSLDGISLGFLLHDIGKARAVNNPDIWNFERDNIPLSELRSMQRHVEVGLHILASYEDNFPQVVRNIVTFHHERLDGSGEPYQRTEGEIPFIGKLAATIDSIIGRCEDRSYHPQQYSLQTAFEMINQYRDRRFDGDILDKLQSILEQNLHLQVPGLRWLGGLK